MNLNQQTFLIFALLSLPCFIASAETTDRSVSVTGECLRQLASDKGSIIITVENSHKDVKVASKKTNDTYADLKSGVEKLKLKEVELETTEYTVAEDREWVKDKMVSKGFKARLGLKVSTSEIARLGEVITVANNLSITDVGSLNSFVSDSKLKSLELECLKEAALDARKKAEVIANTLGARVTKVISVNQGSIQIPNPPVRMMTMRAKSMAADAGGAPEIQGAKERYTLSVQATFKVE